MKHIHDLRSALPVFKCLASDVRIAILELLSQKGPMAMTQIAQELNISNGTLSPHMRQLCENGFVSISLVSGAHGVQRICSVCDQQLIIDPQYSAQGVGVYEAEIRVGQYVAYDVYPTCGLATAEHLIGMEDDPRYFASPERVDSAILWLGHGYVDYILPNYLKQNQRPVEIQISMEVGSEAPGFCDDWPSDISFYLNGVKLCCWTSPGDFGVMRGIYTPAWWNRNWNQYGLFKLLSINDSGTFIDGVKYSEVTLSQLNIANEVPITLRIASPKDARHPGGLTLYGRSFGNYDQDIKMRMQYKDANEA